MHLFVQACILGLLTGGVYALMASGLTLAFGIMRVINVAQGALIILGAYASYILFTHFQIDPFVGILVIAPAMFVLGVALQLAFLRVLPDQEREELSLLVTWAIALGIEGILSYAFEITSEQAFELLRANSRNNGTKLRDLASAIVAAPRQAPTLVAS